jgi:sentrin-specific protease 8
LKNNNGRFIEIDCPQQDNGYDCGLFVLCFTDTITEYVLKTSKVEGCNYSNIKTVVSEKRNSLLNIIYKLQKSKE